MMRELFSSLQNEQSPVDIFHMTDEELASKNESDFKIYSDNSLEKENRITENIKNDPYTAEYSSKEEIQAAVEKVHAEFEKSRNTVTSEDKMTKAKQFFAQTGMNSRASSIVEELSMPFEGFAREHDGKYPTSWNEVSPWKEFLKPPYDLCGKTSYGFEYSCQLSSQGYEIMAKPKKMGTYMGTETYIRTTGGKRVRTKASAS